MGFFAHLEAEGNAPSSIERAYSAILAVLRESNRDVWPPGFRPYSIKQALSKIRRDATHRVVRKRALTDVEVAQIVSQLGSDRRSMRDRALILVGVMGGFRRSELAALDIDMLSVSDDGLSVFLPRSKTDQEGEGRIVGIVAQKDERVCAIHAIGEWTEAAHIEKGPVFRPVFRSTVLDRSLDGRTVARIVKSAVASIGLDVEDFSGHSLRSGFVTTAAKQGKSLDSIMKQTGHRSVKQVLDYIRHATVFVDNASKDFMGT